MTSCTCIVWSDLVYEMVSQGGTEPGTDPGPPNDSCLQRPVGRSNSDLIKSLRSTGMLKRCV
jgi:hypothetical protein